MMQKDFNIKVTVRNARLLRAIRAKFGTSAEIARVAGLSNSKVTSLVTMKARPFLQSGELSSAAEAIVSALGIPADDLWPDHIRRLKAKNATVEVEMDAETFAEISTYDQEQQTVYKLALQKWSGVLSDRQRDIVTRRAEGDTFEDCARDYGVGRERIRQIEANALRKIRGAALRDGVRQLQDLM
jgi:DNA-binding CsgD family transcriptional regulator